MSSNLLHIINDHKFTNEFGFVQETFYNKNLVYKYVPSFFSSFSVISTYTKVISIAGKIQSKATFHKVSDYVILLHELNQNIHDLTPNLPPKTKEP